MLSRSGKSPGKTDFFFKVRKKSRNSVSSQGNTKFYLKGSEMPGFGKGFLVGKSNVVSKDILRRS